MKKSRIKPHDKRNLFFRDGAWWVDIQVNGRRYREMAGPTEARARAYRDKLKSWKRDADLGLPTTRPEGEPVKFETFADEYLRLFAVNKRSYERDVRSIAHLKTFFSGWNLRDINALAVANYRADRTEVSVATINRELACLRTLLYRAVEWGKIAAYPLPKKRLLLREPEFKPRILNDDEIGCLIDAADPRWLRPAIIVWLHTGLRKMELLGLRREDADLRGGWITVIAENAKNGKARQVPINDEVAEILAALPGKTYFFENPSTGKHFHDFHESFKTALAAAEIKGRVRIHDLRDTFATQSLRNGVDIRTVAEIIGDSPEVALKRYCHSDPATKRLAATRMSGLITASWKRAKEEKSRHEVHEEPFEAMQPATNSIS